MKIFIQPNDVLFFRDGKPFEAGGDHIARLSFPPSSITFYGAIKTELISLELNNFEEFKRPDALSSDMKSVLGYTEYLCKDDSGKEIFKIYEGKLRIKSFGLGILKKEEKVEKLYPVPADVVKIKNEETYLILNPGELPNNQKMNMPIDCLLPLSNKDTAGKFIEEVEGFLTEDGFNTYLKNQQLIKDHFKKYNEVFMGEPRICVSRDFKTHVVKEGMLYSIEFARLKKDLGFYLELEGLEPFEEKLKLQRAIRLGGEAKSAICCYNINFNEPDIASITGNFKLVTLTHTIFENGWMPDGIKNNGECSIDGIEVKLVSAAMRKHVGIGGWDLVNNISKPVRRAVPAGSVFYFETVKNNSEKLKDKQFINLGQDAEKGLGQAIIGGY